METKNIKHKLKELLTDYRYTHTIHTAKIAKKLAKKYKEDLYSAEIAGLLHDSAKDIEFNNFKKLKIDIKKIPNYALLLKKAPKTIHSFASAQLAKNIFKITDKKILNACSKHTIGHKKMSKLDKIIYIADLIEPSRTFKGVEKIRKHAYTDLDKCFFYSVQTKLFHLLEHKKYICKETIEMWNSLVGQGFSLAYRKKNNQR